MESNPNARPSYKDRLAALALSDPQLRSLMPDPTVELALERPGLGFAEAVSLVLEAYGDRPALGEREYVIARDAETGRSIKDFGARFRTITYAVLRQRVEALANVWRQSDSCRIHEGDFVCMLGFNGIDYVTIDLACLYARGVSVPLQSTLGYNALEKILAKTAPTIVAATAGDVALAARLVATCESVRTLLVFAYDERVDDDREQYAEAQAILAECGSKVRLTTIVDLIEAGRAFAWKAVAQLSPDPDRVAMVMHSSGTTGTPKGAILLERHAQAAFEPSDNRLPRVRLCIAPLNHTMGRGTVYGSLAHGGTAYFIAKPDMSTLFDDIRLVRPTDMYFFPRALELVHRHYQLEVARRRLTGEGENSAHEVVLAEMRGRFLGDRLCLIKGGGAPTPPEVRQFVTDCLEITFVERYGTTEAGSITVNERVRRPHVVDYRLRDIPELGYSATDTPFPRGELCIKTESVIPGYFKDAEATAELFDSDGYVLTGDIVEERGADHLVFVDRRNDVLKLSNGEFVAAGALGNLFERNSELIRQIYVYGNSARAYLLAVVVPSLDRIHAMLGHEPAEAELRLLIKAELQRIGTDASLRSFEIPREIIVERVPFSTENGLLTALGKLVRPATRQRYGAQLENLYADVERRQIDDVIALCRSNSELRVLDKVGKALEAVLGLEHVDVELPHTFAELGGDSLDAVGLAVLLEGIFNVEIPVSAILSATANPYEWARAIEKKVAAGRSNLPDFRTVHGGKEVQLLDAADLDLRRFFVPAALPSPPEGIADAPSRLVLLTGATGFLGRFLCLEWLERLRTVDGRLICLVRGRDQAAAAQRLAAVFSDDAELESRYHKLAKGRLEVMAGDVTEMGFGLETDEYDRLASSLDRVVHAAALVNHTLPYQHLFAPNVASTAALLGLAVKRRRKVFDFVSSTALSGLLNRGEGSDEDAPLLAQIPLGTGHADGYRTSKWAAEHLLRSTARQFDIPVNIFRSGMILPHREYAKQINVDDVFTRLLVSVISTGLAPRSFYVPASDGGRPTAHYDGLPVDFTAAAMVGISDGRHSGIRTFNVVNHNANDGVSLDVFVDWIEAAGYPVARIDDYNEWVSRFEVELRTLPEDKRQQSSLAVIEALRKPSDPKKPILSSVHFDAALAGISIGPRAPQLTREYLRKCLRDMTQLGLIPAPAGPRAH